MERTADKKQNKVDAILTAGYDWLSAAMAALIIVSVLFSCLFRMVNVDGDSMTNTLQNGDRLLLSSALYEPVYGDIVVIRRAEASPLIKRIIGLPGDIILIDQSGSVYRNGEILYEPYTRENFTPQNGMRQPVVVEEGTVFVMGDNRGGSLDSRMLGCLPMDDVVGKVIYRLSPLPGPVTNGE